MKNEVFLPEFENNFNEIFSYLQNVSPQSALKFAKTTDLQIEAIKQNPKLFPSEKFLYTKQGLYRFAVVMKSWKIIYKITKSKLIFLGIIHTAQHPNKIKKMRKKT